MTIPGHRDGRRSLEKELDRYIPIAAACEGLAIAGLTMVADLIGALGSGTGILLALEEGTKAGTLYFDMFPTDEYNTW